MLDIKYIYDSILKNTKSLSKEDVKFTSTINEDLQTITINYFLDYDSRYKVLIKLNITIINENVIYEMETIDIHNKINSEKVKFVTHINDFNEPYVYDLLKKEKNRYENKIIELQRKIHSPETRLNETKSCLQEYIEALDNSCKEELESYKIRKAIKSLIDVINGMKNFDNFCYDCDIDSVDHEFNPEYQ